MISVNIWGVLLAALSCFIIGFMFHGPLFGKLWMRLANIHPTDNKYDDIVFQTRYGECGKMAMWVLEQMQEYIDTNKKGEK
jgi:hypothetical protein